MKSLSFFPFAPVLSASLLVGACGSAPPVISAPPELAAPATQVMAPTAYAAGVQVCAAGGDGRPPGRFKGPEPS